MTAQKVEATQNERLLSGASHASVIFGFFTNGVGGVVVAGLIWLSQRERSRWAAFQALQALVYQALGLAITLIAFVGWFALYMLSLIPTIAQANRHPDMAPPAIFWLGLAGVCIPFLLVGLWTLYGLWGGLKTYSGDDFRYFLIGDWLAARAYNVASGEEEDADG